MSTLTRNRSRLWLALCLLIATTLLHTQADAQTSSTLGRRANTWAARSSSGLTLAGTWTATEDPKTGAVKGAWTLVDAQGRTIGTGGWSAAKSPSGWSGVWRAVAVGRAGEYSGTWTARMELQPTAKLNDLFTRAIESAISGTWQSGPQSGGWTIQAFK